MVGHPSVSSRAPQVNRARPDADAGTVLTSRIRLMAALALGVAALLAAMGLRSLGGDSQPTAAPLPPVAASSAPQARTGLPHHGDCGIHAEGTVVPVLCGDRDADVQVARVHLGGDPGQICPLYRPNAVLVTTITQDLFVCWVPRGGGPERSFEGPASAIAAASVPLVQEGTCGLIHDDHVHHPLDCASDTINAVADRVFAAGEAGACPAGTAREETLADGARVCWSDA
jgi:hypothetical protein